MQANDAWTSHVVTDGVLDTTQDDFDFLEEIVSAAEKGPEVFLSFLEYLYESDKQLDIVSIASLLFRSATLRLRLPEQLVHYIATSLRRTDDTGEMMMARGTLAPRVHLFVRRGSSRWCACVVTVSKNLAAPRDCQAVLLAFRAMSEAV